mgnify:CR=1 FL=1
MSAPGLALARHVRDRVFRLEDLCLLLRARGPVGLQALLYCVHRINHYGVLSFSWSDDRALAHEAERYLQLVRGLWPRLTAAQRFEVAVSLAKLHQRRPSQPLFAFVREFLAEARAGPCGNYTFNQLMHIAIIMSNRELFQLCLTAAATARPQDLLLVSRLALAKNLSKFCGPEQLPQAEAVFERFLAPLDLSALALSDLLSLYFSANLLLKKAPHSRPLARFLDRLDRRLAALPVEPEDVYRANLAKVLSGNRLRPTLFLLRWLAVLLRAPSSFSRHAALAEAAAQLPPALLTPELLAYFLYEHPPSPGRREALARLERLVFTAENRYLLETLPATPFAFLAERLRVLGARGDYTDQRRV